MKIVATAFSLVLMWSVETAHAAPITFEVEYTTLFSEFCFGHSGACVPHALDSFTRTFTLDSAQLMVDGVYDVTSSLDPIPPAQPFPGFPVSPDATVTTTLVANAIVADEQVIDMVMDFEGVIDELCFTFPKRTRTSFTASFGSWESPSVVTSIDPSVCNNYKFAANGIYTVQQLPEVPVAVPEPGSLLLVLGGALFARLGTPPRVQ